MTDTVPLAGGSVATTPITSAPTSTARPPSVDSKPRRPTGERTAITALQGFHRWLRRMSTALLLLLAVAAGAVLAVAIPQEPTNAATVAHWRAGTAGPGLVTTAVLDATGLFDIFGSWWLLGLSALLIVSLVACLVPRHRALLRSWHRPPPAGRQLDRLAHRAQLTTTLEVDAALAAASRALRRRRHRCRILEGDAADASAHGTRQLAAERGLRAREVGSVLFHDAILLLLVGVAIGHVFGFTGQVDLVEGARFTETRLAYDRASAGPGFGLDDHRGFSLGLEAFRTSDHPNGIPREFVATVAVDGGAPVEVEVNHPLVHEGMRVHLARHGLAPTVRITDSADGSAVFDGPVLLAPAGPLAWAGLASVRDGDAELVVDVLLLPEAAVGPDGHPTAIGVGGGAPLLIADIYPASAVTDDGIRRTIDRRGGAVGVTAVTPAGADAALGSGTWMVQFDGPVRWAGFQVSRTPGLRLLLLAGILLLVGLVVSLYAVPQRIWIGARPAGDRTVLVIAGTARHRPWAFERTFSHLVTAVDRAISLGPRSPTR